MFCSEAFENFGGEGLDLCFVVGHGSENSEFAELDIVEAVVEAGAVDFEKEGVVGEAVVMIDFLEEGHLVGQF
jgi:hypothetical protein